MIRIIADNGADLPIEYIERYGIEVLSLSINNGEKEYSRGLDRHQVYQGMREGKSFKTSQVTMADLVDCFKRSAIAGDELIYIPLSAGISGTYSTALLAADEVLKAYPKASIHVQNSLSAAFGHGMVVIRAAMMADNGKSMSEIIENLAKFTSCQDHLYTVGTLDYLYMGGRISKTSKFLGGMLNIKPILTVDKEDGKLGAIEKARGSKEIYRKICELMKSRAKSGILNTDQTFAICHGEWEEAALKMKETMIEELGIPENRIMMSFIGPVIGVHTGPEMLGVFYSTCDLGEYSVLHL